MPTVEQSMVARSGPYVLAARARRVLEAEASHGCTPGLAAQPALGGTCLTPSIPRGRNTADLFLLYHQWQIRMKTT